MGAQPSSQGACPPASTTPAREGQSPQPGPQCPRPARWATAHVSAIEAEPHLLPRWELLPSVSPPAPRSAPPPLTRTAPHPAGTPHLTRTAPHPRGHGQDGPRPRTDCLSSGHQDTPVVKINYKPGSVTGSFSPTTQRTTALSWKRSLPTQRKRLRLLSGLSASPAPPLRSGAVTESGDGTTSTRHGIDGRRLLSGEQWARVQRGDTEHSCPGGTEREGPKSPRSSQRTA